MHLTEKYITHFNSLNGKSVKKTQLKSICNSIMADIKDGRIDQHVPGGVECIDIVKRLQKVINAMNGHIHEIKKLNVTPITLPKSKVITDTEKRPVVKPKPKPLAAPPVPMPYKAVQSTAEKEVPRKATQKLSGVVSADAIAKLSFKQIPIDGEWKKEFHRLMTDTQVMVWGSPGSGKTVKLLRFAKYLASLGYRVLYVANEEWLRSTFTEKIVQFGINHKNLSFAEFIPDNIDQFDVLFLDSVQSLGMDLDAYRTFRRKQCTDAEGKPNKLTVAIIQTTKEGDFRGGKDWEHEMDVAGEVIARKLVMRKNRYDPEMEKKSEKLLIDKAVQEKEKKHLINEQVKNKLKKPEPVKPVQAENKTLTT
jgi:hypothetical protein